MTHSPHIRHAREDERFGWVEAQGDDVLNIQPSQSQRFVDVQVLPQSFLVVTHLNHKRDIKSLLQPSKKFHQKIMKHEELVVTHFVTTNGMRCPKCIASEDGPRPVYK